jgi:surfeit locus 1 family protein
VVAARLSARTGLAIGGLLLFAGVFGRLGAWQLSRAGENRAVAEQFAKLGAAAPLDEPPLALTAANRFRRVSVRGAYDAAPQFLLDNMLHDGAAGYHVLTVLRVKDSRRRLIVNRGWIAGGADRRVLPDVAVGTEPRAVTGRMERLPQPGLRLGAPTAPGAGRRAESVAVVEYPTMAELSARLGEPLFDYQLLLDPTEPDGYARDWRVPGIGPERNLIYAGQWLLLAVGALGAAVAIGVRSARPRS